MKLDKDQLKAATYIKGHSLIIAGAGSGKTTTLIEKVNHLIDCGFKTSEILVISFTNETVNSFKNKCPHNIKVLTFHKLALSIINNENLYIIDDYYLDKLIYDYLSKININYKHRLFHIYNRFTHFNKNKYETFIKSNKCFSISKDIKAIITISRSNNIDLNKISINKLCKGYILLLYVSLQILNIYKEYKATNEVIDFDDMIVMATKHLKDNNYNYGYKHILVDEYQDISNIRLNLLREFIKVNDSTLTAVGDDFQSIYGFSGSNISLFYNFQKYFKNSKLLYIKTTYRSPQIIIDKAGSFIMKNPYQRKKKLISINSNKKCIKKYFYSNKKKIFKKIILKYINMDTLILFRNSYDVYSFLDDTFRLDDDKLFYLEKELGNIRCMTIHKSKGLEADIVILINLCSGVNGFPSRKENSLIKRINPTSENFNNAEERRLFYVAMTRCRKKFIMLIDLKHPSSFVSEI